MNAIDVQVQVLELLTFIFQLGISDFFLRRQKAMKSGFFGVGVETLLPGTREGGLWIRRFRQLETLKTACVDRHVKVFCTKHLSEMRIYEMRFLVVL